MTTLRSVCRGRSEISAAVDQQAAVARAMSVTMQSMTMAVSESSASVTVIANSRRDLDRRTRPLREAFRRMAG